MKKRFTRRLLSGVLAGVLVVTGLGMSIRTEAGETIAGEMQTVQVSDTIDDSREINFNDGWKFYLGTSANAQDPNFNDSGWDDVTLPHDFSIFQNFTTNGEAESGFLPGGTGWYRKSFTLPENLSEKQFYINFDGVYMNAYVYVNGTYVGEHHYGYTDFSFDITDYLTCDGTTENVIAVKAVNNVPSSRWYSGSGIYRDVTLFVTDQVHVDLNGTKVTTPDIASGTGTVNVDVDVVNNGTDSAAVTVTNTITAKGSDTVLATGETSVSVNAEATATAAASLSVSDPKLWDINHPNLYVVHTVLSVNGQETDSYDTTFGFRYFSFDSSGFHLNGENVKLNGVCLHHDQGALGSAAYYDAMYRQLSKMKDMGCNAIRTSHNPADKHFIEICNELGLLVIEEAFDGLVDPKNGNSNDFSVYFESEIGTDNFLYGGTGMTYAEYAATSMVKRDRNAPSIIAWSFGNEIQEGTYWNNADRYDEIAAEFITWVNGADGTRPVTSGDNNRGSDSRLVDVINTITASGGIAGFNYANSTATLYSLAQSYGGSTGAIIAAETSSATNSRGIYSSQNNNSSADGNYHLTSYDSSCVSWGITAHDSIYNTYQYDCVAGEFIWTGFDYIGEPTPWNGTGSGTVSGGSGATPNSSYFGAVETTGFEKDTYYLYRSQWNKAETTLHLVTAWDSGNMMTTSSKTPVWVYSNAPTVKLYRDGTLIGTATREAHTSAAGHTYYTYTTTSNNSSICTTSSGSGADGLYAVFNVAFTEGTLSAKAFDTDGNEITLTGNSGKNTVTTPGTVSKLNISQDKTEVAADGSSLVYITVDVTDANGNLDTTAANTINFTLSGNGEIVGVDNGDQATTAKYQQSSVLTSTTSAKIAAYAGKALVIVKSTKDAGSFTVNVTSDGLTGGSVSVTTTASDESGSESGLASYQMVRDYTVKAGTVPELGTAAVGIMADGTEKTGTIVWDSISEDIYGTPGDYVINGTLTFAGEDPISVTCRLHVIGNVIALRNISTVTTPGTIPALTDKVAGVLADGTLCGEFTVTWDGMTESQFATVGDVVIVSGTAVIFGDETLPVTASVRVTEEVATESENIAPQYLTLEQDIASGNQSDVLTSITNGTTKPGDNTNERWTNWNNRTTSATATLTMIWATAHSISGVNLYYYYDNCCAYPEDITFSYSLNGVDYIEIEAAAELVESYSLGAQYSYTFAEVVNPVAIKVTFTQQNGTSGSNCVGLTEMEVMTYAGSVEYNTSSVLSQITADGEAIADFDANTYAYEVEGSVIAAASEANAGITILPEYEGVIRILTISEDGQSTSTYEITVGTEESCMHENVETVNAQQATCTKDGYTGDKVCKDCGTTIEEGTAVPAAGHSWNDGEVTKEATAEESGIMMYTCTVCGSTKTEEIPALGVVKEVPEVSLSVTAEDGVLVLKGVYEDYENSDKYYEVTAHGLVYYQESRLGSRNLTAFTFGRTRIDFDAYREDGAFLYRLTPLSTDTKYKVCAFLAYVDENGRTVYEYSDTEIVSCELLQ